MPRCPHCGEAVKPERGPLLDLDDLAKRDAAQELYEAVCFSQGCIRSLLGRLGELDRYEDLTARLTAARSKARGEK